MENFATHNIGSAVPSFTVSRKPTSPKSASQKPASRYTTPQQTATQLANTTAQKQREGTKTATENALTGPEQLKRAVAQNDIDKVKLLVKARVDLRPQNWDEIPVLVIAAQRGYTDIVRILIAANANVNSGYAQLPLHSAAAGGHLTIVRDLIEAGACIRTQDNEGHTAIMKAAAAGQLPIVRFLLMKGARLGAANTSQTVFTLAQKAGHRAVCEFLQALQTKPKAKTVPTVQPKPQSPAASVMDEMIASTTAELNELLAESIAE